MELDSKVKNGHSTLLKHERDVKISFWLVFSIIICVFGNSFLFGHNIGVVNSPAKLIKTFYVHIYLARDGINTIYRDKQLYYKSIKDKDKDKAFTSVTTTSNNVSVPGINDTNNTTHTYNETERDALLARTEKDIEEDNYVEVMWSITVALFVFFGMIGAFASGKIADHFGRKKGMVIITFLMLIAAIFGGIPKIAGSPECLLISRIFVGLHSGISISLASLYLAEISPKKIRGAVGTCHQLFITIGILWSMVLGLPEICGGWEVWPILFAFNALPSLVCLFVMPYCPESPRYLLIKKNDEENARKALVSLRGYDDVEEEIEEMRVEARKASSIKQFTLKQLLTTPELKLPLIIALLMQVAQQLSGINAAMSYSSFIFSQAGVADKTIPYVIVGQGAINVIATIIAVPLMEKLGRRPLLIFPMVGMVLSFLVLTVCLNLLQNLAYAEQKNVLAIICIVVMLTYVIGFALGLGPIPFIVVSELFRQEPRAAAMSFALAFNWICNFILVLTFRFIQKGIGAYTYLIFVVILVASIIFIAIFVPETKNKTFEEIVQSMSIGKRKKEVLVKDTEMNEMQLLGAQKSRVSF